MDNARTRSVHLTLFIFVSVQIILTAFFPLQSLVFCVACLGALITFYYFFKADEKTVYFLFVVSILQNVVVIYLMGKFNISQAYYLQFYKEFFLIGLVAFLFLFRNKMQFNRLDLVAVLFIFYVILIPSWMGEANTFTKFASFRQVIIPFLFYFLGRLIIIKGSNLKGFLRKVSNFGILIVLFGLFECYVSPTFWEDIGIYNYFFYKRGPETLVMVNGLPSNFWTSDFVSYTGQMLRRMASFVANPPVLGHVLGFITLLTLFTAKHINKGWITVLLLSAGVFLTLGKGGVITLVIGIFFYMLFILKRPLLTYILVCIGAFMAVSYIKMVIDQGLSAIDHIFGFVNSLKYGLSHPFGAGLGTVGNLAELYNGNQSVSEGGGAESFLGLVVGQFGVIGFIIFSMFFIMMFSRLIKVMNFYTENKFYYSLAAALLAIDVSMFVTGFLTESSISFTSAGLPLILSSVLITNHKNLNV